LVSGFLSSILLLIIFKAKSCIVYTLFITANSEGNMGTYEEKFKEVNSIFKSDQAENAISKISTNAIAISWLRGFLLIFTSFEEVDKNVLIATSPVIFYISLITFIFLLFALLDDFISSIASYTTFLITGTLWTRDSKLKAFDIITLPYFHY